jgi:hypothetical protein
MSFKGQARWAKVMSPGGKLIALGFHPTNKVNKCGVYWQFDSWIEKHSTRRKSTTI